MKKASEYRRHAEECHALAKDMTGHSSGTNCSKWPPPGRAWPRIEPRSSKGIPNWRLTAKRKRKAWRRRSSMVEHHRSKLRVAGSKLIVANQNKYLACPRKHRPFGRARTSPRARTDRVRGRLMKKTSEYRRLAEECRALAKTMSRDEQRVILAIAAVWDQLAESRAEHTSRLTEEKRMAFPELQCAPGTLEIAV
jgi:hypothetical protein